MSTRLDSDALMAVRRLRRHLTWWRLLTVVGFTLAVLIAIRESDVLVPDEHIARVYVDGVILKDGEFLDMLDEIGDDDAVRAVVVEIESPGGTFSGGESLMDAFRDIADDKPVVAVMGDIATSGGYMAAIGADRIYASRGTLTGSIGVIMQTANLTGLLDKLGIKPETIKSGSAKAAPNPFEELADRERAQLQDIIDEMHLAFMQMVADRRGMSVAQVREIAGDGRVMTGSGAVTAGLVDALGDVNDAVDWLETTQDVPADLPLIEWSIQDPLERWRQSASTALFGKSLLPERLTLDGIQALWHPSMSADR